MAMEPRPQELLSVSHLSIQYLTGGCRQKKKKVVCHSNEQRMKSAIKLSATVAIPMTHEEIQVGEKQDTGPRELKCIPTNHFNELKSVSSYI